MEGEPLDSITQHHARRHQQLGKVQRLDALVLVLLELDPRRGEQLDGVLGVHVLSGGGDAALVTAAGGKPLDCWSVSREVEFEVELPGGRSRRIFPLFVHEGEAQLDDLQQVHVAAQQLVLIVGVASEFTDWSGHHTWKLRVLKKDTKTYL